MITTKAAILTRLIVFVAFFILLLLIFFGPSFMFAFSANDMIILDNYCATENLAEQSSPEQLQLLLKKVENASSGLFITDLQRYFNIERVRHTYQGYYSVISAPTGERLYVFLDYSLHVWKVLLFKNTFLSRVESAPYIEDFNHETAFNNSIPHCVLDTGGPYVSYYYTDGIDIVVYTDSCLEQSEQDLQSILYYAPKIRYQLDSIDDIFDEEYQSFNRIAHMPLILSMDRQNSILAEKAKYANLSDYIMPTLSLLVFATALLVCNHIVLRKYKRYAGNDSSLRRKYKKWCLVLSMDIPLCLFSIVLCRLIGYSIMLLAACIYYIVASVLVVCDTRRVCKGIES